MRETSNMNKNGFDDSGHTHAPSKSGARSFSEIFQEILNHLAEIVRSEIRLARAEVKSDLESVTRAGVFLVIGAVFALYALGFILLGVVYALGTSLAPWLSAVIVGAGAGLFAATFLIVGRAKLKRTDLKPDQTIRSVQENVTWMTKQTK